MKKQLLLPVFLILLPIMGWSQVVTPSAQPIVREGDFAFEKKIKATANGLAMELNGEPEALEELFIQRFEEETNGKVKSLKKNLMALESSVLKQISSNTFDYYFRIEPVSKKEKNRSTVTFFIATGNYNFLDAGKYPSEIAAARQWLVNFRSWKRLKEIAVIEVQQNELMAQESKQMEELEKTKEGLDKEAEALKAEMAKLQEKLTALEEKQTANTTALEAKLQKITELKEKAEKLRLEKESLKN